MKKKKRINKRVKIENPTTRPIDNHFRMSLYEYEYLKRLAFEYDTTFSDIMRQHLFHDDWRMDLQYMRENQRRNGHDPDTFYHSRDKRKK